MCIIVYSLIIYCTSKLSDENYLVPDHKPINRIIDHNLLVWCIQLLLYAVSYFTSTHEALFSQAMISLSKTLNVTTSWVFINIININCLDYIFWNCALNSIIFAQTILWMSNCKLTTNTHVIILLMHFFIISHDRLIDLYSSLIVFKNIWI